MLAEFGRKLRGLRDDANLTQKALARRIGSNDSTLSELERCRTLVPTEHLVIPNIDHA